MDTLAEIQERHSAVKELERSLLELHQLFLDMAVLVEAQGEKLDNIAMQVKKIYCFLARFTVFNAIAVATLQVGKARNYVEQGTKNLQEAKKLQKNTRKYMCFAVICLVILALILFGVVGSVTHLF